jgi:hypothetical protein
MLRFLHWAGFSIWLGAQLTFMVWGPQSKNASLEAWAHSWKTLAKVQGFVIAPAAAVATITGIVMMMQLVSAHAEPSPALWMMALFGLLAGVLAIGVVTPLVNRTAVWAQTSLAAGQKDPRAERSRVRLAWAGSVTGVLILVGLWFGAQAPRILP